LDGLPDCWETKSRDSKFWPKKGPMEDI
jgi:hypothetical protein